MAGEKKNWIYVHNGDRNQLNHYDDYKNNLYTVYAYWLDRYWKVSHIIYNLFNFKFIIFFL